MMLRIRPLGVTLALAISTLAALAGGTAPAAAQAYARFAVPDTALVPALIGARAEFEGAWNALFVASLRAQLADDAEE